MKRRRPAHGFTLVELLVVIAIIGVLVSMSIPAVQASRELGRRNQCRANLAQLMLAMQNYENAFESFPAGVLNPDGPIRSEPIGHHQSWLVQMLPYVDEGNAYRLLDLSASVYDAKNAQVRELSPSLLICPTEPNDQPGASSYAGCHHDVESPIDADNHGVLFLNSHVRRSDITDGLSHTLVLGEKRMDDDDLGWMSGTRAMLRNTGLPPNDLRSSESAWPKSADGAAGAAPRGVTYVGGFAGSHTGGVMTGFADASVRFIAEDVDLQVWQQLGHRADGKLLKVDLRE